MFLIHICVEEIPGYRFRIRERFLFLMVFFFREDINSERISKNEVANPVIAMLKTNETYRKHFISKYIF